MLIPLASKQPLIVIGGRRSQGPLHCDDYATAMRPQFRVNRGCRPSLSSFSLCVLIFKLCGMFNPTPLTYFFAMSTNRNREPSFTVCVCPR